MTAPLSPLVGRPRHTLTNRASGIPWRSAGAVLLVLAGVGILAAWGDRLILWQQVTLWGALSVVLAVVMRRGLGWLLGPVFGWELARATRHGRLFSLRMLYAGILLVVLLLLYLSWFGTSRRNLWTDLEGGTIEAGHMAEFAASCTWAFLAVQFGAAFLLTPAFTAGAIAEEKERRTLEDLLTTDLRAREVVLGKLAARAASLGLLFLTGLPVLGLLQFVGGVDPALVLAGFAVTGVTLLSLASLGLLNSVLCRQPYTAIFLTYAQAGGYLLVTSLLWLLPSGALRVYLAPVDWLAAGDVFVLVQRLTEAGPGLPLMNRLLTMLRDYALFHGLVALVCVALAVLRLRAQARRDAQVSGAGFSGWWGLAARAAPRLGNRPVLWKELHTGGWLRHHTALRNAGRVLIALAALLAVTVLLLGVHAESQAGDYRGQEANVWTRIVGTALAYLLLLLVAVRAAGSLSGERDRQTLDGLLTTPLQNGEILRGKWLGSILSVRRFWWVLGGVWLLGVVTGGLHPLAVPLLVMAWLVHAAFLAGLGLWFSLVSQNTLRAILGTLLTMMVATVCHWVVGLLVYLLVGLVVDTDFQTPWAPEFHVFGLTPPVTLAFLAFYRGDLPDTFQPFQFWHRLDYALIGLGCYAAAALLFWGLTAVRFARVTGRMPLRRPGVSNQ